MIVSQWDFVMWLDSKSSDSMNALILWWSHNLEVLWQGDGNHWDRPLKSISFLGKHLFPFYFLAAMRWETFLCHTLPLWCSALLWSRNSWVSCPWTDTSQTMGQNKSFLCEVIRYFGTAVKIWLTVIEQYTFCLCSCYKLSHIHKRC